jgi:D-lactate dehydrogenase
MRIAAFSTKPYDRRFLKAANESHELSFIDAKLGPATGGLAAGFDGVCVFVNDIVNGDVVKELASGGVRLVALRCAGFNNVALKAASEAGLTIARVPAYSPSSVAEHIVALIVSLNRKMHRAFNRVREGNLSLDELLGFDLCRRTVGIVGTGEIGVAVAGILKGFGCHLLAYDVQRNPECEQLNVKYVELDTLYSDSDIITVHCPLTADTRHMIG